MAALAYVLLPFSGLIAYFLGGTSRVRFHGLQAVILGVVWPVLLYACSAVAAVATQVVFVAGACVWLLFVVGAAAGKDPRLPLIGRACARAVELDPN
jgi:uncharacterized membrane protein